MTHPLIKMLVALGSRGETIKAEKDNPQIYEKPDGLTPTEDKLFDMLWESTGAHMMDSGFYGRAWEQRRKIPDFRKQPQVIVEIWEDSFTASIDIFHFLNAFVTLSQDAIELQTQFEKLVELSDNSWMSDVKDFSKHLMDTGWATENDGYLCRHGSGFNTYNGDSMLDGVIQGDWFLRDDETVFLALQIHGGADVRGGYSKPQFFEMGDMDYWYNAQSDLNATCRECGQTWHSDCHGYRWYRSEYGQGDVNAVIDEDWKFDQANNRILHKDCPVEHEDSYWKRGLRDKISGLLKRVWRRNGIVLRQKPIEIWGNLDY